MRLLKPNSNHACQPLSLLEKACATGKWNSHPGGAPLIRIPFPFHTRQDSDLRCILSPQMQLGCIQLWSAQPHPCPAYLHFPALQYSSNSAWGLSCLRLSFWRTTKTSLFPPNKTLTTNLIIIFLRPLCVWGHRRFFRKKRVRIHSGFEYWSHHLLAVQP